MELSLCCSILIPFKRKKQHKCTIYSQFCSQSLLTFFTMVSVVFVLVVLWFSISLFSVKHGQRTAEEQSWWVTCKETEKQNRCPLFLLFPLNTIQNRFQFLCTPYCIFVILFFYYFSLNFGLKGSQILIIPPDLWPNDSHFMKGQNQNVPCLNFSSYL